MKTLTMTKRILIVGIFTTYMCKYHPEVTEAVKIRIKEAYDKLTNNKPRIIEGRIVEERES